MFAVASSSSLFREEVEHPSTYGLLNLRNLPLVDSRRFVEAHTVALGGEHAVDQATVEVQVSVECRAEALDEGHATETGIGRCIGARRAQLRLDGPQEDLQHAPPQLGVALQEVAQALGKGEHPLAHRQARKHVVDHVRRHLHHAPCVAGRTHPAPLAGERNQEVVPALGAPRPGETVCQDSALEVSTQLTLNPGRHAAALDLGRFPAREPGLPVLLHDPVEHAPFRAPAAVNGRT
jgi:hypothetical protein